MELWPVEVGEQLIKKGAGIDDASPLQDLLRGVV